MTDSPTSGSGAVESPPISIGELFHEMRFSRTHLIVGAVLFVTFVVEAWEQVGLIYVGPGITEDLRITNSQLGLALSAVAFGMVPGALLWSVLVERRGRKVVVVTSLLAYALLAGAAALAPSFTPFVVLRFLSGVAFGGVYAVTFPYFIELLPTRWRGQGAVALSIGFPVGTLLCIGVSWAFGSYSWRVVALVAAFAGLWAIAVLLIVPESPYWLVKKGRTEQARQVLRRFGVQLSDSTPLVVDAPVREEGPGRQVDGVDHRIRYMRPAVLLPLVLVVSFTFSWGYWGLQTWLPALLQGKGMSVSASLLFVAITQLVSVPGYLLAAGSTRLLGRRIVFIVFAVASVAGAIVFAVASGTTQMYVGNLLLAFFSLGAWGIWNTWSGEVLPTSIRGAGYAASTAAILLAQTIAVPTIGLMMDNSLPLSTIVVVIAAVLTVSILAVIPLPETEGRALR